MVTMTEEKKRVLNYLEVKAEYDGRWVLFDHRDFPPEDDMGYVVACGDGSDEDRDAPGGNSMQQESLLEPLFS